MKVLVIAAGVLVGIALMVAGAWWMHDNGDEASNVPPISATATYPTVHAGQTQDQLQEELGEPTMAVEHRGVTGWIWKAGDGDLFVGFVDGKAPSRALCPATSLEEDACIQALANGTSVGHALR
jgi:hypothetical protein